MIKIILENFSEYIYLKEKIFKKACFLLSLWKKILCPVDWIIWTSTS